VRASLCPRLVTASAASDAFGPSHRWWAMAAVMSGCNDIFMQVWHRQNPALKTHS
jgi:hypothetical protein